MSWGGCWPSDRFSVADYIQLYHGNASLLAESSEVIQQTVSVILAALEPPIAEAVTTEELAEVAVENDASDHGTIPTTHEA